MTKIRSAQSLSQTLTEYGRHAMAEKEFADLINEILKDRLRQFFPDERLTILEQAMQEANKTDLPKEKVWLLRSAIDTVYDLCVDDYNSVDIAKPLSIHKDIKNVVNDMYKLSDTFEGDQILEVALNLIDKVNSNKSFKSLISPEGISMLTDATFTIPATKDLKSKFPITRSILDRLYNEIRLPEVFWSSPNSKQVILLNLLNCHILKQLSNNTKTG